MKNFALTGVAGYVAKRHLKAVQDTGNHLVAAYDPRDSVGIMDSYFPYAAFFTDEAQFKQYLLDHKPIDYVGICSPNFEHDNNIRLAFDVGADAICEKPLTISQQRLDDLANLEAKTGRRVYTVLQLRLHPSLIALKTTLAHSNDFVEAELTYITPRGPWYDVSWKGFNEKSGGVVLNIGLHLFDMMVWLFGNPVDVKLHMMQSNKAAGVVQFERARVKWYLSIDRKDSPEKQQQGPHRVLRMDGQDINFTEGFDNLHTRIYERVLAGKGYRLEDARPGLELVYRTQESQISANLNDAHYFIKP